jgi:hypothetical protein
MLNLLLLVAVLGQATSAFNTYAVNLEPATMRGTCRLQDAAYLRSLSYPFRVKAYAGDGWSTEIEGQDPVQLGDDRAVLLTFFANHLSGTGSLTHVFVVRCKGNNLEVVFEAAGEGVRSSYSDKRDLRITHPYWLPNDSHASPSRSIEERYRWDSSRARFVTAAP